MEWTLTIGDNHPIVVPHKHIVDVIRQGMDGVCNWPFSRTQHKMELAWSSATACAITVTLADIKTVHIRAMQSSSVCLRHWLCSLEEKSREALLDTLLRAAQTLPADSFFVPSGDMNCEGASSRINEENEERGLQVRAWAFQGGGHVAAAAGGGGRRDAWTSTDKGEHQTYQWPEDVFKRKRKKKKKKRRGDGSGSSSEHTFIQKMRKKSQPGVFSWKHRDHTLCVEELKIYQPFSR